MELKQQAKKAHELDSLNFETFHWIIRKSASLLPDIQHFSIQQYKDVLKFSKQIALLEWWVSDMKEVLLNFTKRLAWFDDIAKANLAQKVR
ncbi:hypothetical protein IscW_ISCW015792 [Ixodes scapularis]|uniref:Uncharacterized protein n=1 Tax=Ixodes scapularis TaxID=6945 RepID=B7P4P3_IXOSC|nr:hypothetical protein IscW_ISCW015792 [Ixodes scapularis]|eukprot:XP_002406330.1 hypothetical protein IscW_ISCW015792 [Ixodes scapularis]